MPNVLKRWDEATEVGAFVRKALSSFTSTFKDQIVWNDFKVHCTGIRALKQITASTSNKKTKRKIKNSSIDTWVLNVLPLGFKKSVRDV